MKVEQAKALDEQDHRALALWAADCAERVLPLFEGKCPEDDRPRGAIEAGRAWARGEIAMGGRAPPHLPPTPVTPPPTPFPPTPRNVMAGPAPAGAPAASRVSRAERTCSAVKTDRGPKMRMMFLLAGACVGTVTALSRASAQAVPAQAACVSRGTPRHGGHGFRPNSPLVTVRPTVIVVSSGSGRKSRVALHRGQRLTFYSPQMTRDSIARLPDGRLGFVHTQDIRPARR